MPHYELNHPRIVNAWCSYDWANSAYNLAITATIFPIYYSAVTADAFGGNLVTFFGLRLPSDTLYSFAIAFSFLLAALLAPFLSGVADYGGSKKRFMKFFTYMGSAACLGLYFFTGPNIEYGVTMAVLASMGYAGAIVFYLSYLPEIASPERWDAVSARGFSLGYIGCSVQLVLSLVLVMNHEAFGISENQAARLSFIFVGVWWVGFAQIAFRRLPDNPTRRSAAGNPWLKGVGELRHVWRQLKRLPYPARFLASFFFFNMGAQSVFLMATLFGKDELHLSSDKLIATILLLQLVGVGGAYLFAACSQRFGNRAALAVIIVLWIIICAFGYVVANEWQFYALATGVGVCMGGMHISRSTYAKLIPADTSDHTSFFSFYDVTEKLATVAGTASYGAIAWITGSVRNSILALVVYFVLALVLLAFVRVVRPTREV